MQRDHQLEKWIDWIQTVTHQVSMLYLYRRVFKEVDKIVENNQNLDRQHLFFGFLSNTYVDSVVMGIRRQIKANRESISLARLLHELAKHPDLVTRSAFYEHYTHIDRPAVKALREEVFNRFADSASPHIDSALVQNDIKHLKTICAMAERYADRRIAHWDITNPVPSITYDDIDETLDSLGEMVQKYYILLRGAQLFINPGLPYPISDIFREPWLSSPPAPK